jgi:thiosulfate dehydrogenase [quinone] large subunit
MSETRSASERVILLLLRLSMAWTFLYAASHQVLVPGWSATGFLEHTKTFHGLFSIFTGPVLGPITSFLVEYGHLLIGLSLLFGVFTRASASFGILLMLLYWMAHMDFPYITNQNNLIVDSHIVYALVLWLVIVTEAGRVWGLDGIVGRLGWVSNTRLLAWAAGTTAAE